MSFLMMLQWILLSLCLSRCLHDGFECVYVFQDDGTVDFNEFVSFQIKLMWILMS